MEVCNCSMFCCTLLYVHSSIAVILVGKRELVASLNLSSWCLVMVERLFFAVLRGCLRFVVVVFPDNTHLLFLTFIIFPILCMRAEKALTSLHKCTGSVEPSLLTALLCVLFCRHFCDPIVCKGYQQMNES